MIKKEIKYKDLDGNEVTEEFYFNLTKAELIELEFEHKGGMENLLKRIVNSEDYKTLIHEFKRIILMAYGKKSEDGKRFIKSDELRDEFKNSMAYSELFMEFVTNADAAAAFINGVMPAELAQAASANSVKEKTAEALGITAQLSAENKE